MEQVLGRRGLKTGWPTPVWKECTGAPWTGEGEGGQRGSRNSAGGHSRPQENKMHKSLKS